MREKGSDNGTSALLSPGLPLSLSPSARPCMPQARRIAKTGQDCNLARTHLKVSHGVKGSVRHHETPHEGGNDLTGTNRSEHGSFSFAKF